MKFITFVFLFTTSFCFSQVDFIHNDLEKAMAEAKVEHKIIMVDVYADWCGWCKRMDATTFSNEEVSEFVGKNLIALKINSDKGNGPAFASKYGVRGLPTIVYLDHEGNLIKVSAGYKKPAQLLSEIEPYKLKERILSKKSTYSFEDYSDARIEFKQSIKLNTEDELGVSLEKAVELGNSKKAFEIDELKAQFKSTPNDVAKLDVFYLLGAGKSEDAAKKIKINGLIGSFTKEQTQFIVLNLLQSGICSLEMLQMINEHSIKTKDVDLLDTKAAIQFKLGDIKDAEETLALITKLNKKRKVKQSQSITILKDLI